MLIVSYDISDNRLRTRFAKFLSKYGYRLQYSVFNIKNSDRIIKLIKFEIEHKFSKKFVETDSVLIYTVDDSTITKYGYPSHEDEDLLIIS